MQAIRTKYIPVTNFKGSRIQAKCEAKTIYLAYDHALNIDDNHRVACQALRVKMNWNTDHYQPMVGGCFGGAWYWVFMNDTRTKAAE